MKRIKGFTLVELLVAISIIAVLSTVGTVSYSNSRKAAQDLKIKADIDAIAKAYESTFNVRTGKYGDVNDITGENFTSGSIPKMPNGSPYPVTIAPNNKYFTISVPLSDGNTYDKSSSIGVIPTPTNTPTPTSTPTPTPTPIQLASAGILKYREGAYLSDRLPLDNIGNVSAIEIITDSTMPYVKGAWMMCNDATFEVASVYEDRTSAAGTAAPPNPRFTNIVNFGQFAGIYWCADGTVDFNIILGQTSCDQVITGCKGGSYYYSKVYKYP